MLHNEDRHPLAPTATLPAHLRPYLPTPYSLLPPICPKESTLFPELKKQKEQRNRIRNPVFSPIQAPKQSKTGFLVEPGKITFDTASRPCYYSTNQIINDVESEEYPAKRVVESWPFCWKANVSAAGEWAEESPGRMQLIVAQVGSPRYRAQVSLSS